MGSLKSPCMTSYWWSIDTIALNCLVFEKIAFFCILATDEQMDSTDALRRSRVAERRLNYKITGGDRTRDEQGRDLGETPIKNRTSRGSLLHEAWNMCHLKYVKMVHRLKSSTSSNLAFNAKRYL